MFYIKLYDNTLNFHVTREGQKASLCRLLSLMLNEVDMDSLIIQPNRAQSEVYLVHNLRRVHDKRKHLSTAHVVIRFTRLYHILFCVDMLLIYHRQDEENNENAFEIHYVGERKVEFCEHPVHLPQFILFSHTSSSKSVNRFSIYHVHNFMLRCVNLLGKLNSFAREEQNTH